MSENTVKQRFPEFLKLPDLAAQRLGGSVVAANDEFFAEKENLLKPAAAEWREGIYTDRGKWMDGWETRRRREPGNDWAVIRLGLPGIVHGVVIDTTYFTGNYPEFASVDACTIPEDGAVTRTIGGSVVWTQLLPKSPLKGDTQNLFVVDQQHSRITHVRLNIFPDGGVARLRVHGEVVPDEELFATDKPVDLAALASGGRVIACSDMHYGNPNNMLLPGRSTHMGDGWETKRRRGPGNDWSIIELGHRGIIESVELDTDHFKGNAPGSCAIEIADVNGPYDPGKLQWSQLIPRSPVKPHSQHHWRDLASTPTTHVRLSIYPDGGVARLRLFGRAVT
jgi:allantoicase